MKNIVFTLIGFLFLCLPLAGQDLIILRSGNVLEGKVELIDVNSIQYREKQSPNGPLRVLLKADLLSIKFENGTVEKFDAVPIYNNNASTTPTYNAPVSNVPAPKSQDDEFESEVHFAYHAGAEQEIGFSSYTIGGKGVGAYFSSKIGLEYGSGEYTWSDFSGGGYFENTYLPRWTFTGGITYRLAKRWLYGYSSAGFGIQKVLYDYGTDGVYEDSELSGMGFEIESGIIFRVSDFMSIPFGYSTFFGPVDDGTFTIGLGFNF